MYKNIFGEIYKLRFKMARTALYISAGILYERVEF